NEDRSGRNPSEFVTTTPKDQTTPTKSCPESQGSSANSLNEKSPSTSADEECDPEAEWEPDAETLRQIKQSDFIYETCLKYMDWEGKYSDYPLRYFKPGYFLQPDPPAEQFNIPGLAAPVPARCWPLDGPMVAASAVWIETEEQEEELEAWAKNQGRNGSLCPDTYLVREEKLTGWVLDVDP
ncbi:MAG: hypothetical protein Q9191_008374, partial [Dirinaria sp. TL-2023a]